MTAALSPRHDEDEPGGRMSLLEHLEDLRKRLIHACVALLVGMVISLAFMRELAAFILAPTRRVLPKALISSSVDPGNCFR